LSILLTAGIASATPTKVEMATYLGGTGDEAGNDIVSDPLGNIYVLSTAYSPGFPLLNAFDTVSGGSKKAAISKFSSDGTLLFSSYLGGSGEEVPTAMAVDDNGLVYVTGHTWSADFPATQGYDTIYDAGGDIFVTKIDPVAGVIVWSTFVGGANWDYAKDIAFDSYGRLCVTGYTRSTDFPMVAPVQATIGGGEDCFVIVLSADGKSLDFSTYFGGSSNDRSWSIDLDNADNIIFSGHTASTDFPTLNAYDAVGADTSDLLIVKFETGMFSPYQLKFSTYLGGNALDYYGHVAVDNNGQIYVTGYTNSSDFPLLNAYDSDTANGMGWSNKGLFSKFDQNGNLLFSGYWGKSTTTYGRDIGLDENDHPVLIGYTRAYNFPLQDPLDSLYEGQYEAYVSILSPDGQTLEFSTYYGGSEQEIIQAGSVGANGDVYVTGWVNYAGFPTVDAYDDTHNGNSDVIWFVLSSGCCENPGDFNHDGALDVSDLSGPTSMVAFMFLGGPPPPCPAEGDFNGDGTMDVADLSGPTSMVAFLFLGGPPPVCGPE